MEKLSFSPVTMKHDLLRLIGQEFFGLSDEYGGHFGGAFAPGVHCLGL